MGSGGWGNGFDFLAVELDSSRGGRLSMVLHTVVMIPLISRPSKPRTEYAWLSPDQARNYQERNAVVCSVSRTKGEMRYTKIA